jgi:hypothetical protein
LELATREVGSENKLQIIEKEMLLCILPLISPPSHPSCGGDGFHVVTCWKQKSKRGDEYRLIGSNSMQVEGQALLKSSSYLISHLMTVKFPFFPNQEARQTLLESSSSY